MAFSSDSMVGTTWGMGLCTSASISGSGGRLRSGIDGCWITLPGWRAPFLVLRAEESLRQSIFKLYAFPVIEFKLCYTSKMTFGDTLVQLCNKCNISCYPLDSCLPWGICGNDRQGSSSGGFCQWCNRSFQRTGNCVALWEARIVWISLRTHAVIHRPEPHCIAFNCYF